MKKVLPFLAVAFSGFLVYLFDKIWGNSIDWENLKDYKLLDFLSYEIRVYQLILFGLFISLVLIIGHKSFKKEMNFYSKKQSKLREYNKTEIHEAGILLRWSVYFNYETPFISDLTAYCTKHLGAPIRFIHNRCPVDGCENAINQFNELGMQNAIESDLIDKWEKMK